MSAALSKTIKAVAEEFFDVMEICFTAEDAQGRTINIVHGLMETARAMNYLAEMYARKESEDEVH